MTRPTNDDNVNEVIRKMAMRSAQGLAEYGTTTMRDDFDLEEWLRQLQAEMMDGIVYIEAALRALAEAREEREGE